LYLLCLGGTVDVVFHEVKENGIVKELHRASGGHWGGTTVDEEFKQFLITCVGHEVIAKFQK